MYGKLSLQQSPPFSVPFRFFITATVFGILAALIFLIEGKDLLVSRWTPGMLAITHCLVLGFYASIMMGAVQQLLPIVAGAVINRPLLIASLIHLQWTPGVLLLVWALMRPLPGLFILAVILISGSILTFVFAVLFSLYKAPSINESVAGIKLAVASLFVTLIMGITLSFGYMDVIPLWRPSLTNLHLTWGLIGWIAVLIMAVAWQVVPMFQITNSYPRWLTRYTVPVFTVLLLVKSLLSIEAIGRLLINFEFAVDIVIATCLGCFAVVTLQLQKQSRRKIRDSHRDFWRLGMFNLILACLLWVVADITGNPLFDLLTASVFILGFAMAIITGMLLKIVSFLIWLHLQAASDALRKQGKQGFRAPKMKAIISSRSSDALYKGLILAELSLIAALVSPDYFSVLTGILWFCQFFLLTYTLARAMFKYNRLMKDHPSCGNSHRQSYC